MDVLYSRADVIETLRLPTWPKAARETVDAHIAAAVLSCARVSERLPERPVDPSTYARWTKQGTKANGTTPLMHAVR